MAPNVAEKPDLQTSSEYSTEGVFLAAWLMYKGHALKCFRMDGERGRFIFDSSPELAKHIEQYFSRPAQVNDLRAYVRTLNRARDVMMDAKRKANGIEPAARKEGGD